MSKGKFDLVPKILANLGVKQIFYQVAQRPGMPMYFGSGPAGQAVFGLPGNPVSTCMCLVRYVVPALVSMSGRVRVPEQQVSLAAAVNLARAKATSFLPVKVQDDEHGMPRAVPAPTNGPGDFLALRGTDGFVELPPRAEPFAEGFVGPFYRW